VKAYAKLRQRLDSELRIAKYLKDQRAEQVRFPHQEVAKGVVRIARLQRIEQGYVVRTSS